MSPRRSRRRSGGPRRPNTLLGLVSVLFLTIVIINYGVFSAGAFRSSALSRTSSADVVSDANAIHGLDQARVVNINSTDPLVNVTNRFRHSVTITVSLRADSVSVGELVVGGSPTGSEAVFVLNNGETKTVSITIPDNASLAEEAIYFSVDASAPSFTVTAADRSVPVNA